MINLIDILIIAIALVAALGALLLLRPPVDQRDLYKLRKIRQQAEKDQQDIARILSNVQHGAKDHEYLSGQLKSRIAQINADNKVSQSNAASAEQMIIKAKAAKQELHDILSKLGKRIEQIQEHWNNQLAETTGSIKQIKTRLNQGLQQVDEGLLRLQEQEKTARGLTHQLLQHQKEHLASHQKNNQVSAEIHSQLENILHSSTASLETIQEYQQQAGKLFDTYTETLHKLEQRANEQFAETFQSTDMVRQELTAGLQENRQHLEKLRQYEVQGNQMHERIKAQFEQVDPLKVARLGETVDLTDEMCVNLQEGLENARALLSTLEEKTVELVNAGEKKRPAREQKVEMVPDERPHNLFSLRTNR
ncbi:MAG: hypothetical protein CSA79_05785 [Thiothrix nivea]|nr:MAG: hypothetical protein CSA79_05785 [Thiothrix nivea]